MAKFLAVFLVYSLAAVLTSCSASRPLSSTLTGLPADTVNSKSSITDVLRSASVSTAVESINVSAEQEGAVTESESGEVVKVVAPPCMENFDESSSVDGERPCHRSLSDDYGSAHPSPHTKYP